MPVCVRVSKYVCLVANLDSRMLLEKRSFNTGKAALGCATPQDTISHYGMQKACHSYPHEHLLSR